MFRRDEGENREGHLLRPLMAEGEEGAIEQLLEQQLEEQRATMVALDEALGFDPSNSELLSVREEIVMSIRDAEDGLLHLKRSRLLREVDKIASVSESDSLFEDPKDENLHPTVDEVHRQESEKFSVGSKCRFRHTDGRWYNGYLVELEGPSSARISFLNPTSEKMLMCKFFLQQRCSFGSSCRMSHGFEMPISCLKPYKPTTWQESLVGSNIWAVSAGARYAIWREAELESWDDKLKLAHVVFRDGATEKLGIDSLSLSSYAELTDNEEEDDDDDDEESSSETSSSSELDGENSEGGTVHRGLGFLQDSRGQIGVQTRTALFATWEHHTRGIASKMMVSMGYREGMGLGVSGQGMVDPIPVKVLLPRQSLDHAIQSMPAEESGGSTRSKKRSRGGKRVQEKKQAAMARANQEEEQPESDMFSFINEQLAGPANANGLHDGDKRRGHMEERGSGQRVREDRRSLLEQGEKVKELRARVERLEEMISRNKRDKGVFEAASRKLEETRKTLVDAEAAHASASHAITSKEKEKRWLKF